MERRFRTVDDVVHIAKVLYLDSVVLACEDVDDPFRPMHWLTGRPNPLLHLSTDPDRVFEVKTLPVTCMGCIAEES